MKESVKGVRGQWEKYKYVVLVALAGIGLLLWPECGKTEPETLETPPPSAVNLQREMEELLGNIAGVGTVRVMLTMESDGEKRLAQNTDLTYSRETQSVEKQASEVILSGGERTPTVVQTVYPTYRGALVVCQGGDRPDVRLAVTRAVTSLTGLPSDRVSVAKWQ